MDTPTPSQDDINLFVVIVHQIEGWWRALVAGGFAVGGGFIWRASSKYTAAEIALRDHAERIDRMELAIRGLEAGEHAISLKLESLPTRDEMDRQFASVRADIRALVSGRVE